MKRLIADFHVHSHFSRATSGELTPEHLDLWARLKGVDVLGSGDFTHPGWLQELREKLEPAEPGLFKLKPGLRLMPPFSAPWLSAADVRFILSGEISSIYKKGGRVRKVHSLILAPGFDAVEEMQRRLGDRGANILSDGRPILGIDVHDLLELMLEASAGEALFIPAHIWTPWFSLLGDKSGFDSVGECFGDLEPHIHAVETGLSSDPAMNWLCSFLDRYTLVSNSDAHSPEKIGREANLFHAGLSYAELSRALCGDTEEGFAGTVEFFPQEGKYHFDGHRKCGVCWHPDQTRSHGGLCPACGKPLTVGVMSRVLQLADRQDGSARPRRAAFHSLIPLKEILGEICGLRPESRRIGELYRSLIKSLGPELTISLDAPLEKIRAAGGDELAEGIHRMRERQVLIEEGYDGEYGRIRVFGPGELAGVSGQKPLLSLTPPQVQKKAAPGRKSGRTEAVPSLPAAPLPVSVSAAPAAVDPEQEAAIGHGHGPALVIAGPGTGKTRVLAGRISRLIAAGGVVPEAIMALTFTNRAAREMRERLSGQLSGGENVAAAQAVTVGTFHAFGLSLLKEHATELGRSSGFALVDESDRPRLIQEYGIGERRRAAALAEEISWCKQRLLVPEAVADEALRRPYRLYEERLLALDLFDLDDLIMQVCWLLETKPGIAAACRRRYDQVLVDECQDLNEGQYQLLRLLQPQDAGNLFLVGDPDQAIYGFRGADETLLQRFLDDYAPVAVYHLRRSYRCSGKILRASGGVLAKPEALTGLQPGLALRIAACPTDRSEAEFIARAISAMVGGTSFYAIDTGVAAGAADAGIAGLGDFAVLCRTAAQFTVLREALAQHGLPTIEAEDQPYYQRQPARSLLDLLHCWIQPGREFHEKLLTGNLATAPAALAALRRQPAATAAAAVALLRREFFGAVDEQGQRDLQRLEEAAGTYGTAGPAFVQDLALGRGQDTLAKKLEGVALLTLHAAKGLEFACVFIAGCEEGLLPFTLFPERAGDPAEENRLLYVGMTRAKSRLFLTHAGRRRLFGRTWELPRSHFLDRIERGLFELDEHQRKKSSEPRQRKLFDIG